MNEENAKQLQKLAKVFNTDNVITVDEIQAVLKGVATVLANFKKSTEGINADTVKLVNSLVSQVEKSHANLLDKVSNDSDKTQKEVLKKLERALGKVETAVKDIKSNKPKDGKDGNDGKTPVKGVDYFTPREKEELISDILKSNPEKSAQ
jgi:predicted component of type VI protein secretion system